MRGRRKGKERGVEKRLCMYQYGEWVVENMINSVLGPQVKKETEREGEATTV